MYTFVGLSVLIFLVLQCFSINLPADIPRCYIDDPDLDKCFVKAANDLLPRVLKGIPELGVPPFNPNFINMFDVSQSSQLVDFNATCTGFNTGGFNYKFKTLGFDPKTSRFHGELDVDFIQIDSGLKMHGRLLAVPLDGTGTVSARFGPIHGKFEIEGEVIKMKGEERYKTKGVRVKLNMGEGFYHFEGLFANNPELRDNKYLKDYTNKSTAYIERIANNLLNQNAPTVTIGVTPALEGMAEGGLTWLMRSISKAIPFNEMFPKKP